MLEVVVFEGVQNLPIFAAQDQGFFAADGVQLRLHFAPNSWTLRDGLANGTYDIAHTAVDNAIAMTELAGADVAVVMGGDSGFNCLVAQQGIRSVEQLRGRKVLVDAPNTAFALVLYKIMALHGIHRADYEIESVGATPLRLERMLADPVAAASIMNLPFRVQAERLGLHVMGEATDFIGPYLSTSAFVMRAWTTVNGPLLTRYIRAYIRGLRWALDPANTEEAVRLLAARLRLPADVARDSLRIASTSGGFARDAALDERGLENVLRLRADVERQWAGQAPPVSRYVDLVWYRRAMRDLDGVPA
jgi:ABC-type nitrate/sulfonate/bicarbonate transport system substrate-binding protein